MLMALGVLLALEWGGARDRLGLVPPSPGLPVSFAVAFDDGSLARLAANGDTAAIMPADALPHVFEVSGMQIAADTRRGVLWYSDSHTSIRSVDLATHRLGVSLGGFADVALVGCATTGDGRPLAIDSVRRQLYVPVATGGVLAYDLDTMRLSGVISSSALETETGLLPAVAVDERSGALWYGASSGAIVEIGASTHRATGRRLVYAVDAHTLRAMTVADGRLLALGADGTLRAYDLARLREVEAPLPPSHQRPVGISAIPASLER